MSTRTSFVIQDLAIKNVRPYLALPADELEQRDISYGSEDAEPENISDGQSALGTPVFSNLEIMGGEYVTKNGETITYEGLERDKGTQLDVVLFQVQQQKNIQKTSIQGRKGTVKELISPGDYQVQITGGIYDTSQYPKDQVERLIKICEAPVALEVNSWFLRMFGIYNLVVEDYDFKQRKGHEFDQVFNLQTVADEPIELEIDA